MAKQPEILELMRQANFMTVFVGIETPEARRLAGELERVVVPLLPLHQVGQHVPRRLAVADEVSGTTTRSSSPARRRSTWPSSPRSSS
jgi:hypothetical protein